MDPLEKKICIVSAGHWLPKDALPEELDLLFAQAKDCPTNNSVLAVFFKNLMIEHLEAIANAASQKRRNINAIAQEGYFWELKATFYLYSEAKSLIQSISEQCPVPEFKAKLKRVFREKGDEWGYGCNWSESIQRFVLTSLREELEKFTGDLREDGTL